MAKKVFFSFHYQDVTTFRANVVRNHGTTKDSIQKAGFFDSSIWESAKRYGNDSVKRLINSNLENTSVTCALIGTETWSRPWVRYEILKSYDRGNLLFGIHINSVLDKNRQTFLQGKNPFDYLGFVISADGRKLTYYEHDGITWKIYNNLQPKTNSFDRQYWGQGFKLSNWVPCYDWISGNGFNNFSTWIDNAK